MLLLWSLLGCPAPTDAPPPAPQDTAEPALTHQFSFAILADPHITTNVENEERLAAAVAWINDNAAARDLALVVVVGDIGWGEGLPIARALLDDLAVPYVPILGDNEIYFGDEEAFDGTFSEVYTALESSVEDLRRGAVAVDNPEEGQTSWFQNLSFSYGGVRFVGLDWCSRSKDPFLSEGAQLHDFAGGTWPWFESALTTLDAGTSEDVLLFSHHPMHLSPGGFDLAELERVSGITGPVADRVAVAFAGHYHFDFEETMRDGGYDVVVTDAVWDDENTVRVVDVQGNGERFTYPSELVVVP